MFAGFPRLDEAGTEIIFSLFHVDIGMQILVGFGIGSEMSLGGGVSSSL